jgi:hypothetical protein
VTTETESEAETESEQPASSEPDNDEPPTPLPRLVLGVRPPDSVSWRIHGPLAPQTAKATGASIVCTTTFAARKAQATELERPVGPQAEPHGVLGGPMPARDRSGSRARVGVEVQPVMPNSGHERRRDRAREK